MSSINGLPGQTAKPPVVNIYDANVALQKFLRGKVTVQTEVDGYNFTSQQFAKRKTEAYLKVTSDLSYVRNARYIKAGRATKAKLVTIAGYTFTPEQVKRAKRTAQLVVRIEGLRYSATVTAKTIKIGCQTRTWADWKKNGEEVIRRHYQFDTPERRRLAQQLLPLVLANREKITARIKAAK